MVTGVVYVEDCSAMSAYSESLDAAVATEERSGPDLIRLHAFTSSTFHPF